MLQSSTGRAVFYTVAGTLLGAAVSYAATRLALTLAGYEVVPMATYLSIGLPLLLAPATMVPLIRMNSRQRQLRMELEHLVHTDMLTGLPNRRAFFAFAATMMERDVNRDAPLTAMMIDIDHFKAVNDTAGHSAGDAVLKAIATTIRDAVAASQAAEWTVARLGGEEFAVLFDGLVPTAVARLADSICFDVRALRLTEIETPSTVSIGVAFRAPGMGIDPLIKLADDAVYAAKHNGRDRWAFGGDRQVARHLARPLPEPANDRRAFG